MLKFCNNSAKRDLSSDHSHIRFLASLFIILLLYLYVIWYFNFMFFNIEEQKSYTDGSLAYQSLLLRAPQPIILFLWSMAHLQKPRAPTLPRTLWQRFYLNFNQWQHPPIRRVWLWHEVRLWPYEARNQILKRKWILHIYILVVLGVSQLEEYTQEKTQSERLSRPVQGY